MADERIRQITRPRRCRCAATTSTPTASCRRASSKSITFEGLEQHLFEDDRAAGRADASVRRPALPGRVDPGRERELRLRLVARARAAGAPALRASARSSASRSPRSSSATRSCSACRASPRRRRRSSALMALVEARSADRRSPSICSRCSVTCRRRRRIASRCPQRRATRSSTAAWDATGLLLDDFDEVDATSPRGCLTSAGSW